MPLKKRQFEEPPRREDGDLSEMLADELKSDRQSGQPTIYEDEFRSGRIRVLVVWDKWDRMSMEDRTAVILRAYRGAFGQESRDRIALASGLTVPEACAAAMLPFQIISALRSGDGVTVDQCRQAMIDEGASTLLGEDRPLLRFQTEEDAEAAKQRLIRRLPHSDAVWVITQDVGTVEQWTEA